MWLFINEQLTDTSSVLNTPLLQDLALYLFREQPISPVFTARVLSMLPLDVPHFWNRKETKSQGEEPTLGCRCCHCPGKVVSEALIPSVTSQRADVPNSFLQCIKSSKPSSDRPAIMQTKARENKKEILA